jgi:hypothetical protein
MLKEQPRLRYSLSLELGPNERTIQRWAEKNTDDLVFPAFLSALRKHAKINPDTQITEEVEVPEVVNEEN